MILADTSAWIEFDRATGSTVDVRLTQLIVDDGSIAMTEPVMMEVLAGARTDARDRDLRRLLQRFHPLSVNPHPTSKQLRGSTAGAARTASHRAASSTA